MSRVLPATVAVTASMLVAAALVAPGALRAGAPPTEPRAVVSAVAPTDAPIESEAPLVVLADPEVLALLDAIEALRRETAGHERWPSAVPLVRRQRWAKTHRELVKRLRALRARSAPGGDDLARAETRLDELAAAVKKPPYSGDASQLHEVLERMDRLRRDVVRLRADATADDVRDLVARFHGCEGALWVVALSSEAGRLLEEVRAKCAEVRPLLATGARDRCVPFDPE